MRYPAALLDLLIDHDAFRVCRFMTLSQFVSFCRDRGVDASADRLRQLEVVQVFRPMLRTYHPDVVSKIEMVGEGFRDLGPLEDGEEWGGETRTELAQFDPTTRWAEVWRDEGLLWSPGQGDWPHAATIDSDPHRHEAWYSPFQILPLSAALTSLTMQVAMEWAAMPDGSPNPDFSPNLRERTAEWGHGTIKAMRGFKDNDTLAALCQLLANRYYFNTQTDGRRITVRHFRDWEWRAYARAWDARALLAPFDIKETRLSELYEWLDVHWWSHDPIGQWWGLAQFISLDRRKYLRKDALAAVTLREMAHMLRLWAKDAFGSDLAPLGESGVQIIHRTPDVSVDADPMRALELTANQYGLNYKPQLTLLVEGETEARTIPVIFEHMYGANVARYGIEVLALDGVGNADGGKGARWSALWRLVDYLHHHQTMTFVLLDNEGYAAANVRQGLPKAASVHSRHRRATRPDLVKVWRRNFEFDNFSDTELAAALNASAGAKLFDRADIKACREDAGRRPEKGKPLLSFSRLYRDRVGLPLDKPALGIRLVDMIFDPMSRRKPDNRPIVKLLMRVARKAALNHQPHTQEGWEQNQLSGHLGTLLPVARRARRTMRTRTRRARR